MPPRGARRCGQSQEVALAGVSGLLIAIYLISSCFSLYRLLPTRLYRQQERVEYAAENRPLTSRGELLVV